MHCWLCDLGEFLLYRFWMADHSRVSIELVSSDKKKIQVFGSQAIFHPKTWKKSYRPLNLISINKTYFNNLKTQNQIKFK